MAEQTARRPRPAARVQRIAATVLLLLPLLVTVLGVAVVVGSWRDDAAISSNMGRATAEVVSVSYARTIIRFTTPDGSVHSPPKGVLYPGGLEPGQLIRIEYDVRNPDLARVADRDIGIGLVPVGLTVLGAWAVCAPIALWLRSRTRLARVTRG